MNGIQPQVEIRVNHGLLVSGWMRRQYQPMVDFVGSRIKKRLADLGKTQGWLAGELGVSDQAVTKWIKSGRISRSNSLELAKALRTSLDELFAQGAATHKAEEALALYGLPPPLQSRVLAAFDWLNPKQQEKYLLEMEADAEANREALRIFGKRLDAVDDERVAAAYGKAGSKKVARIARPGDASAPDLFK